MPVIKLSIHVCVLFFKNKNNNQETESNYWLYTAGTETHTYTQNKQTNMYIGISNQGF